MCLTPTVFEDVHVTLAFLKICVCVRACVCVFSLFFDLVIFRGFLKAGGYKFVVTVIPGP